MRVALNMPNRQLPPPVLLDRPFRIFPTGSRATADPKHTAPPDGGAEVPCLKTEWTAALSISWTESCLGESCDSSILVPIVVLAERTDSEETVWSLATPKNERERVTVAQDLALVAPNARRQPYTDAVNHESRDRRSLSSPMIAAIAVAVVVVIAIAVLVGVRIGQSVLAGATSSPTASPVPSSASNPTVENTPSQSPLVQSPEPTQNLVTPKAVPVTPAPSYVEPVAPPPLPEQSFVEAQPLPPMAEAPEELPAALPSPTSEPACPADNGVALTITKAELVREGGALDEYKLTLELHNKIAVPVNLTVIDGLRFTSVRASGEEMPSGYVSLSETYEVPPGRKIFTTDAYDHATIYHGFGSPVTAFKLSGDVRVENGTSDQIDRSLFCEFRDVTYGKPLQGVWGS